MKIYYNRKFIDCYTVVLESGEVYSMSKNPQIYNTFAGMADQMQFSGKEISFNKLPVAVKHAIGRRL